MFKRNRHLVDNSSVCVAYLTANSGGTAYTVNYAESKGLKIINLAEQYYIRDRFLQVVTFFYAIWNKNKQNT